VGVGGGLGVLTFGNGIGVGGVRRERQAFRGGRFLELPGNRIKKWGGARAWIFGGGREGRDVPAAED